MVSKAREDLPLPESPVTTTITSRGRESETFFRLCSRAPRTTIRFSAISGHSFFEVCSRKVYGLRAGGQVRNCVPRILPSTAHRMIVRIGSVTEIANTPIQFGLWANGPLLLLTEASFLAFRLRYSRLSHA